MLNDVDVFPCLPCLSSCLTCLSSILISLGLSQVMLPPTAGRMLVPKHVDVSIFLELHPPSPLPPHVESRLGTATETLPTPLPQSTAHSHGPCGRPTSRRSLLKSDDDGHADMPTCRVAKCRREVHTTQSSSLSRETNHIQSTIGKQSTSEFAEKTSKRLDRKLLRSSAPSV